MKRIRAIRISTLFMLSVMATLMIGSTVHTFIHSTHSCEHSSDCDGEQHNHQDCKICNFNLSIFDIADEVEITFITTIISTLLIRYIPKDINVNTLASSSRAPPKAIRGI